MDDGAYVGWHLISSHGLTLLCVARNPGATLLEVSRRTGLTPRRIGQIVRDLHDANLFSVERQGRRNTYRLNRFARLHEVSMPNSTLGDFLDLFAAAGAIYESS